MSDSPLSSDAPRDTSASSIQKTAIEIVYRLTRAVRMSRIYETNNRIFLHQIRQLFELIQSGMKAEGQVMFSLRQNSLFFNEHRIKFGFSVYYLFKFMQTSMLEKEIGELIFLPQLAENELTGFILLLASRRDTGDDVFERFAEKMFKNKILSIHVEKLPPYERTMNPEKAAKKIFFLSVTHLKEIFEYQEDDEKRASVLTTKRLMQSIFNLISENDSFLFGLTNIKNFDEYTLNHSINVCVLSISLGKKIGLDRKELVDLGLSAFFHDLGKLDIPKEILEKPGKLNESERLIIQQHPFLGAEKLAQLREFRYLPLSALNVAMEHHTRLDDTGYPQYTKKQTVNLYSKIVKIVDVFDALTTERPYRTTHFSQSDALRYMLKHSGSEFDPILLKVFINMMGDIPVGTPVLLDSGEIGITWANNPAPQFRLRPKVKLITDENGNLTDGEVVDLSETLQGTNTFPRTILKSLDPKKYHIRVPDYFVAEAE